MRKLVRQIKHEMRVMRRKGFRDYVLRRQSTDLFTSFVYDRMAGKEPGRPMFDKVQTPAWIASLGYRVPATLALYESPEDIRFESLPERFVLKPSGLWSSTGVQVLRRDGARYFEMLRRQYLTREEIQAVQRESRLRQLQHKPQSAPKIIAEEAVIDEVDPDIVPLDYKLYCFRGRVEFIVQIDRAYKPVQVAFFRRDFEPVEFSELARVTSKRIARGKHRLPHGADGIVEAARTISCAMNTPFISVDCYASTEGPVVGELTPTPGGPLGLWLFHRTFDEHLGRCWREAMPGPHRDASQA